ncbi:MAG: hypothetical protein WC216_00465 [Gallionella sp.]|jgi:hypothetical protein
MKYPNFNIFIAWFLIPQTLAMGWLAFAGRMLLELFGIDTQEQGIPGRIVGALILLGAIYLIRHLQGGTLPIAGNPDGKGYRFGHRMIMAGNCLAACLFIFQFTRHWLTDPNIVLVLSQFTTAFGYWVMALWAIGFSFLYQSTQSGLETGHKAKH